MQSRIPILALCKYSEQQLAIQEYCATFYSIYVSVGDITPDYDIANNAFTIGCTFDLEFYNNANETERCKYYVSLLKGALHNVSKVKDIPLNSLNDIIDALVDNNFIYSWNFKSLTVPELNLRVKLSIIN